MKSKRWLISLGLAVVLVVAFALPACEPSEPDTTVRLKAATTMMLEDLKLMGMIDTTGIGCLITQLVYDHLWIMGWEENSYDPMPLEATSWVSDDGKTWNFTLREDATFHDGTPVTAEDVAFSFEYLVPSSHNWQYQSTIVDEANVINNYTVQLVLTDGIAGKYPAGFWLPIVPKHIWEPYKDEMKEGVQSFDNAEMIGSGPYKLKDFEAGEWVLMEANEDYWGIDEGQGPNIDEILVTAYGTREACQMALASKEVDLILCHGISALNLDLFEGDPSWTIHEAEYTYRNYIGFNLLQDTAFANSLDVRKAVYHAIDRDYLIDLTQHGMGAKIDSLALLTLETHNPGLPQYAYNVTVANQLLDDAGYNVWSEGVRSHNETPFEELSFMLTVCDSRPTHVDMGTLIVDMLEVVGIELEMEVLDKASWDAKVYNPDELTYDISLSGNNPDPASDWIWNIALSTSGSNQAGYNNTYYDDLLTDMLGEIDWPTRKAMLWEMQDILSEDLPYAYLTHDVILDVLSTDFEGYIITLGGATAWFNPWSLRMVEAAS